VALPKGLSIPCAAADAYPYAQAGRRRAIESGTRERGPPPILGLFWDWRAPCRAADPGASQPKQWLPMRVNRFGYASTHTVTEYDILSLNRYCRICSLRT
jgi:hypothetical protein